ncbi:M28 family metallopeptidase [Halomonas sp. V046]|uniref:M28 family metallopeptidase n=1 Tax=Halomonas sp. V046 TaxID=3459611 RepID=UPI004044475E
MKFRQLSATTGSDAWAQDVERSGGWVVRAGRRALVVSANDRWPSVAERLATVDADASETHDGADKRDEPDGTSAAVGTIANGRLHGVRQKGRTFQQAHPEIPVLLDAGRYLVVDVSGAEAQRINARRSPSRGAPPTPCFELFALRESTTLMAFAEAPRRDGATPSVARSEALSALVASASAERYAALLSHLVGYPTRLSTSSTFSEAAAWAQAQLAAAGLEADQQAITLPGGGTSSNVVAHQAGRSGASGEWLVVAHLDSVNHAGGASAPAPGADDNASGAAGLLLMAEVLAGHRFDDDVRYVLFGGEEQGLHGSRQYVAGLSAAERARIKGVLNMDMIGSVNATPQAVLLEGAPVSQSLIDALGVAAGRFTSLEVQVSLNPFASDHVPFIDAGVPAVLTIEGADSANDAVHTGDDVLATIDIDYAMQILAMNLGFVAEAAGLEEVAPAPGVTCICRGDEAHHQGQPLTRLTAHCQALFAQYRRLQRDGRLDPGLLAQWQQSERALEALCRDAMRRPAGPASEVPHV